ncbi:MAG: hypothetical protein MJ252_28025, partial [archaeon]|nr:hypothetical protein [archaeon]
MNELPDEEIIQNNHQNNDNLPKDDNEHHHHQRFKVEINPVKNFDLFSNSDPYIYQKNFCTDLPLDLHPPKMFHYHSSIPNLCKPDILTMTYEVSKNSDLLSDPKLNTSIQSDFINNILEMLIEGISTENVEEKINKEEENNQNLNKEEISENSNNKNSFLGNKRPLLKKEILEIIEKNEEEDKKPNKPTDLGTYYSRATPLFQPSLHVVKKDNILSLLEFVPDEDKNESNKEETSGKEEEIKQIKNKIEKTFKDIDYFEIGQKHPTKEGVFVKRVYDILPYTDLIDSGVFEFIFPKDPMAEIKTEEAFVKPNKYIMEKHFYRLNKEDQNEPSEYFSLFKREQLKEMENVNPENNLKKAELYSSEKDYKFIYEKEVERFNRHLVFLNKENNTAEFVPITNKIALQKFKLIEAEENQENNEGEEKLLGKKRERLITILPKDIEKETFEKRRKLFENFGMEKDFDEEQKIDEVDYEDVDRAKLEKENSGERFLRDDEFG